MIVMTTPHYFLCLLSFLSIAHLYFQPIIVRSCSSLCRCLTSSELRSIKLPVRSSQLVQIRSKGAWSSLQVDRATLRGYRSGPRYFDTLNGRCNWQGLSSLNPNRLKSSTLISRFMLVISMVVTYILSWATGEKSIHHFASVMRLSEKPSELAPWWRRSRSETAWALVHR